MMNMPNIFYLWNFQHIKLQMLPYFKYEPNAMLSYKNNKNTFWGSPEHSHLEPREDSDLRMWLYFGHHASVN